jgi:hypothetical protein
VEARAPRGKRRLSKRDTRVPDQELGYDRVVDVVPVSERQ